MRKENWKPPQWIPVVVADALVRCVQMGPGKWHAHCLETLKQCLSGECEPGSVAAGYVEDWENRRENGSKGGRASVARRNGSGQPRTFQRAFNGGSTVVQHNDNDNDKNNDKNTDPDTDPDKRPRKAGGLGFEKGKGPLAGEVAAVVESTLHPSPPPEPSKGTEYALQRFMESPCETVWNLPTHLLPNAMAIYCNDPHDGKAQRGYEKEIRRAGSEAVRKAFAEHIKSTEGGDLAGARKPGALLMKRLQRLPALIR